MGHRGEQVGDFFLGENETGLEFTDEDEEALVLFAAQGATATRPSPKPRRRAPPTTSSSPSRRPSSPPGSPQLFAASPCACTTDGATRSGAAPPMRPAGSTSPSPSPRRNHEGCGRRRIVDARLPVGPRSIRGGAVRTSVRAHHCSAIRRSPDLRHQHRLSRDDCRSGEYLRESLLGPPGRNEAVFRSTHERLTGGCACRASSTSKHRRTCAPETDS